MELFKMLDDDHNEIVDCLNYQLRIFTICEKAGMPLWNNQDCRSVFLKLRVMKPPKVYREILWKEIP